MTPRSSLSSALRAASMPSTLRISMTSLDTVRAASTSGWHMTSSSATPSVSSTHSVSVTNPPAAGSSLVRLASRRKTLRMPSTPCSFTWLSMEPSMRLRKTSSSAAPGSPPPSLPAASASARMRMRRMSLSALSSLNRQCSSSSKSALIFSATWLSSSFLSTIMSRAISTRSSHGLMRATSTSPSFRSK